MSCDSRVLLIGPGYGQTLRLKESMHGDDDELQESGCIEHSGLSDSGAPWGGQDCDVFEVTCVAPETRATSVVNSTVRRDSKVVDAYADSAITQRKGWWSVVSEPDGTGRPTRSSHNGLLL